MNFVNKFFKKIFDRKKDKVNFISICLHCLDMRDFHSYMRDTPFLDSLRSRSIFIPMGRAQGHHCTDSLNSEITGIWTARFTNSEITDKGFVGPNLINFPKTVFEYLEQDGYSLINAIGNYPLELSPVGTIAEKFMKDLWLKDHPERMGQFNSPKTMESVDEWLSFIKKSKKPFYAHIFLRDTHRPWGQLGDLCALEGIEPSLYPDDAYVARKMALEKPDEFAALRRRGLKKADDNLRKILEETKDLKNTVYLIYSNHGEVFDHFRYQYSYTLGQRRNRYDMIEGTSHGALPYEVLYANMQMWIIPGLQPKIIKGIGRSIDITPTILDLANIKHSKLDGESILKSYNAGYFKDRERYTEGNEAFSMVRGDGMKILSTGLIKDNEKLEGIHKHKLAVFDLKADPYEYNNLIDTPIGIDVLKWAVDEHKRLKIEFKV
jgi:hypothetical protein